MIDLPGRLIFLQIGNSYHSAERSECGATTERIRSGWGASKVVSNAVCYDNEPTHLNMSEGLIKRGGAQCHLIT